MPGHRSRERANLDALAIHQAYVDGNLEALRRTHGPEYPNVRGPHEFDEHPLEYAIHWSPLEVAEAASAKEATERLRQRSDG